RPLGVAGGAVGSGSFQAFDQTYLADVLPRLGAGWVGGTQIPEDCSDQEIARLAAVGVRALRLHLFRGNLQSGGAIARPSRRPAGPMRSPAGPPRSTPMRPHSSRTSPRSPGCRRFPSIISA